MSRKVAFRDKHQNRTGMLLVSVVVFMIMVVVVINTTQLKQKQAVYLAREAELDKQIAQEQDRTEELAEFKKYTQTQAYIEEVAKDKLGLVREGEIVFKMN